MNSPNNPEQTPATSTTITEVVAPPEEPPSHRSSSVRKIYNHSVRWITQTSTSANPKLPSPLKDIRVLDLTRILAGPYCTMILSDLGADVIKIERPNTGDESRQFGPPFLENSTDAVYFTSVNRNKRSVCVDFKKGAHIIVDLAQKCDVLVENYIPGKLAEYGLGYEQLKDVCPSLIYCSVTGYGSNGPYAKKPGYDVIAAAYGGLLNATGPENGDPVKVGVAVTDLTTGLYAHGAILAALFQRIQTGRGQKIDVNLLSTQLSCLANLGSYYLIAGMEPKRRGTAHESIVPYQAFKTRNGYLCVGTGSNQQFHVFCNLLGIPHIAKDARFATNKVRVENRAALIEILTNIFEQQTNDFWFKKFENAPFPFAPINNLQQAFNDRHVQAIDIVKTVEHPKAGPIRIVGPPVSYSDSDNSVKSSPPVLGQHTDEVLKEYLNYDQHKIEQLRLDGAIS